MPTNQLAPPDMPWLTGNVASAPNGLGPPLLNYAAPPPDASTSQGAAIADTGQAAWQWLQDQRAESVRQGLLDPNTGLPTQAGLVDAARQTAEGVMMGTTAPGDVPPPGIVAYHGSPHSFDQFDTSKIGTGEGAQAYGHGLYFAEKEGTAQSYRDALTPTDAGFHAMDTVLGRFAGWSPAEADVREALTGHDAIAGLADNPDVVNAVRRLAPDYNPSGAVTGDALRHYRTINDAIEASAPKGSMYQVNIGADPEHFLDWDKPLSEQHPNVQSLVPQTPDGVTRLPNGRWGTTLNGEVIGRPDGWPDMSTAQYVSKTMRDDLGNTSNWTGSDLHSYLAKNNPGAPAAPAEQMQAAGIPGIRYLDQGSRGAGQGTHNYVVFDASTIDILRKYGIAGLIAGGGAMAAGTQQQQPQPTPGS